MSESHGIYFNADDVQMILDGKRQRLMQPIVPFNTLLDGYRYNKWPSWFDLFMSKLADKGGKGVLSVESDHGLFHWLSPCIQVGDMVYAKEMHRTLKKNDKKRPKDILIGELIQYKTGSECVGCQFSNSRVDHECQWGRWRPWGGMKEHYSRCKVTIRKIRAQRPRDLFGRSPCDIEKEGYLRESSVSFDELWERDWLRKYGRRSWNENAWHWVYEWEEVHGCRS